jgi:hypothetical protein
MSEETDEINKWDVETESIKNKEGKSSYPEFFSDEKIRALEKSMSSVFFSCQFLNNPLTEDLMIFDLKKLHFVRTDQFNHDLGMNLCVFDPSLGKRHSDYPAVWWLNYHDGYITFFDAVDRKIELPSLIALIANKNKLYGIKTMLFENNGMMLIREKLEDAHRRIDHRIYVEDRRHSTGEKKEERIYSMQPDLYSGFVRFMSDYKDRYPEAMNQIVFYPAYRNDDFPDCAQMGIEYYRKPHFHFVRYEEML